MKTIETLVFCDLETTGLPAHIGKKNVQITEFSFVSVNRTHFEESKEDSLRILNKLSLCIQPRSTISHSASQVSGLWNLTLQDEPRFDASIGELITKFLAKLKPPICLVAHNGDLFDFPILAAELRRVNFTIHESILCVDSMTAVGHIFNNYVLPSKIPKLTSENGSSPANNTEVAFTVIKPAPNTVNAVVPNSVPSSNLGSTSIPIRETVGPPVSATKSVTVNHCLASAAPRNEDRVRNSITNLSVPSLVSSSITKPSPFKVSVANRNANLEETTKNVVLTEADVERLLDEEMNVMILAAELWDDDLQCFKLLWDDDLQCLIIPTDKVPKDKRNTEITPDGSNKILRLPDPVRKSVADQSIQKADNVRKKLEFGDMGISVQKTGNNQDTLKRPFPMGLSEVHNTLFGERPKVAHYAEADTLALLKICHKIKNEFLEYADGNSKYFHQIQPMW